MVFTIIYKMVLTFKFVYEFLRCNHSNANYWVVLSCGIVDWTMQVGPNSESVDKIPKSDRDHSD